MCLFVREGFHVPASSYLHQSPRRRVRPPAAHRSGGGKGPQSEHQRIIEFWTQERVAQAQPRDFRFDPSTRQFTLAARPPGGGGTAASSPDHRGPRVER